MKTKIALWASLLLLIVSCQSHDTYEELVKQDVSEFDVENLSGIQRDIAINILTSHYGGYKKGEKQTRALRDFTISPLVIEGDTTLYIAQYPEGWEIFSANTSAPMILFSSDKGTFDLDDPLLPPQLKTLIMGNAYAVSKLNSLPSSSIDKSWIATEFINKEMANFTLSVRNSDGTSSIINSDDVPPGYWVPLESKLIEERTEISPKLTKTIWDQLSPWNKYSKKIKGENNQLESAVSGCVAVALAQFMYVTHYKIGIPKYSVTSATLNSKGDDYTFSGESSEIWDKMATERYMFGTDYSALLIGKVGHDLKADYGLQGTPIYNSDMLSYIDKTYGGTHKLVAFDLTKAMNYLKSGYPVVSEASRKDQDNNSKKIAHAFLIDRYRKTIKKYKNRYGRVRYPLPPETIDRWALDVTDADGNIIEYAYVLEEISENESTDISMNWGNLNGIYDNVFYYPTSAWTFGNYVYDLDHKMVIKQ